ncbi:MAG: fructose-6-phosphate aldolase [Bacillota bacterium]|nr:fructose-6-phosphate aldolase [Bacillota bacterium]
MKLFLDTANVNEIREALELGVIDGVTTNPTLIAREGRDFKQTILEICSIVAGPVSAEVIGLTAEEMVREARVISSWAPNVVVKIPLTPEGLKATKVLSAEGIKTNVTLCFSAAQALLAAKGGATYVSPFVGRIDDSGHDGLELIRDIVTIFRNYDLRTEIITASIRQPLTVIGAAKAGAHIATVPMAVVQQMFKHPLTDLGIQRFLADWQKVPKQC